MTCISNQLASLDVSKNTLLTKLDCSHNQLSSLNVSKNTSLTELNCDNNQMNILNISNNTALIYPREPFGWEVKGTYIGHTTGNLPLTNMNDKDLFEIRSNGKLLFLESLSSKKFKPKVGGFKL